METGDQRPADVRAAAQALNEQGQAALQAGDFARAASLLQTAVARWRGLGDPAGLATALHNGAIAHARLDERPRAVPLLEEAIALLEQSGNRQDEAVSRNALGTILAELKQYPQARAQLEAALALRRAAGNRPGEALTLAGLAHVAERQGERLRAAEYRRQRLAAIQATGDPGAEAAALLDLARALAAVGDDSGAFAAYEQAIARYEQLADPRGLADALLALAQARFDAGDDAGAVAPVQRALPLLQAAGTWDARATQWEHFLLARQVREQVPGMIAQWQRGTPPNVADLQAAIQRQLGGPEDITSPVLRLLAGTLNKLGHTTPPAPPGPPAPPPAPAPRTADELAAQDTRSVHELLRALQDPDAKARRIAALALARRGDMRAVAPLIGATRDRSQWVRGAAVRALGKLGDSSALAALQERLEDRAQDVRLSAAAALGALPDPAAVDALTLALTDPWWRVVQSAEKGLRRHKAAPRPDVLVHLLLAHPDAGRRYLAAERLGALGERGAADPLLRLVRNRAEPVSVRSAALTALVRLGAPQGAAAALDLLREAGGPGPAAIASDQTSVRLKQVALEAVGALGDSTATAALIAYLSDGHPGVRYAAIQALGAVGDGTAIPALEHIQESDPEIVFTDGQRRTRLRSAAADAIRRIHERTGRVP